MSMMFLVFFLVVISARADDCQTFCESRLGKRACSRGTWCNDDLHCHLLFWTGRDQSAIFFGNLDGDHTNRPVRCSEFSALPGLLIPPIHLHRAYDDNRPRVRVRFTGHPGISPTGTFSFILDTGSCDTHVVLRNESLGRPDHEGYEDLTTQDSHIPGPVELWYGTESQRRHVRVARTISERIEILGRSAIFRGGHGRGSVSHPTALSLTVDMDEGAGVGLYGAGRDSAFAESFGVFTFIPTQAPYLPWTEGSGGSLMVGERRQHILNSLCRWGGPVQWFPLKPEVSTDHWIVGGHVGVEGSSQRFKVNWMIDTGAREVYIPPDLFTDLVARIRAVGGVVDDYVPGMETRVHGCFVEETPKYPTILISIGDDLTFRIEPADYLEFRSYDVCRLNLKPEAIQTERPTTWLAGMVFLAKTITTFDWANDRIGFCPPRPDARGHYEGRGTSMSWI